MHILLLSIGKTEEAWLKQGIEIYAKRLKHYLKFESLELPALKNTGNMPLNLQKEKESELILSKISSSDVLILLDEKGKSFSSEGFAAFLNQKMNAGVKKTVFVIGGPFGFSENLYKRADEKVSLSQMTFSHQMVRLFFTEQLYRAMTILKGEKYHHS
jgi:23S rRNA (pseudouridine1915-N3)-methyltransferase